jgi:hypothetical protein
MTTHRDYFYFIHMKKRFNNNYYNEFFYLIIINIFKLFDTPIKVKNIREKNFNNVLLEYLYLIFMSQINTMRNLIILTI